MQSSFSLVHIRRERFASVQRQRPRRALGGSCQEPNSSRTLKGGRCASRAQLQRRPYQKRLGRSPTRNFPTQGRKSPSGHRAPVAHAERRRVRVRFQDPPCLTVSARLATEPPAATRLPQRLRPIRAKDLGRMNDAHWAVVRRRVTVEVEVRDLLRRREAEQRAARPGARRCLADLLVPDVLRALQL